MGRRMNGRVSVEWEIKDAKPFYLPVPVPDKQGLANFLAWSRHSTVIALDVCMVPGGRGRKDHTAATACCPLLLPLPPPLLLPP